MLKISVVIPTYNRPELLKKAVDSVLAQTFSDFEVIVVDDGLEQRAERIISGVNDPRVTYIQHEKSRGGGAARNTGIKNASGDFVAFLDDDDEWIREKLEIQMRQFENTPNDVGFCFSAVKNIKDNYEYITHVPEGIHNYHEVALESFKKFLTVTLIIKKAVFGDAGYFDEKFPSHQEAELMIRVTKKYKGLGINEPLTLVNMKSGQESVGKSFEKRIVGREMILSKHMDKFKKRPKFLAGHYFTLGLLYRDNGRFKEAGKKFMLALKTHWQARYFFHYVSMFAGALPYKLIR